MRSADAPSVMRLSEPECGIRVVPVQASTGNSATKAAAEENADNMTTAGIGMWAHTSHKKRAAAPVPTLIRQRAADALLLHDIPEQSLSSNPSLLTLTLFFHGQVW